MNLSKSNTVFSFGPFKHSLSANAYNVIEFAWPVKAYECYANKIESGALDALALTVLELLNLQYLSLKQIADDLGISKELLDHIIDHELLSKDYCEKDKNTFKVTEKGSDYLRDLTINEISKEKVFGYMFQSLIDGEFFPFFYEGTLPDPWRNKDDLFFLDTKTKQKDKKEDTTAILNKINRAYHKFGYIYHKSKEVDENSIYDENMFVDADDDIYDQDFDSEDNTKDSSFVDVEEKNVELKDLKNARIKLLKTAPKELYIKFRLYSLKDEPDFFQINSPFEENETKWYSESFARMRRDSNVMFGQTESAMEELDAYCSAVTKQMYIDVPELKELNPEEYLERTYPELNSCSIKAILKKSYLRLIRQEIVARKGYDNESDVIMNVYRTLELILNNYIKNIDKEKIVNSYFEYVGFETDIDAIQDYFGITDELSAINSEKKCIKEKSFKRWSMMKNFNGNRNGTSLREKYYFLMYAAYLDKNISFAKAIKEDKSIIVKIDIINKKRNEFGGHNGGYDVKEVDSKVVKDIVTTFNELSGVLVSNFDK